MKNGDLRQENDGGTVKIIAMFIDRQS